MQAGSQLFQGDPFLIMLFHVCKYRAEGIFLGGFPAGVIAGWQKSLFGKQDFQNLQQDDLDGKRSGNGRVRTLVKLLGPGDQLSDFRGSLRRQGISGRKEEFAGKKRFQIAVLADVVLGEAEQFQVKDQGVVVGDIAVAKQGVGSSRIDKTDLSGRQDLRVGFGAEHDASFGHI